MTDQIGAATVQKISKLDTIETCAADVRVGLQTGDDFRFLRLFWEVPINTIYSGFSSTITQNIQNKRKEQKFTKRWAFYSKTDEAADWYSPITLVVDWKNDGDLLKANVIHKGYSPSKWVQSEDQYFKAGFSYMLRSSRLVPYIVPRGCIPTAGRSQVFPQEGKEVDVLAICASNIGSAIARFRGEKFGWPKFQAGMIQQLPYVELEHEVREAITKRMMDSISEAKEYYSGDETTLDYVGSPCIQENRKPRTNFLTLLGDQNEKLIAKSYGLTEEELHELELDLTEAVSLRKEHDDSSNDELKKASTFKVYSYLIGCVFGRWNINASNVDKFEINDIYQALPLQSLAFNWKKPSNYTEENGIADLESLTKSVIDCRNQVRDKFVTDLEVEFLIPFNEWVVFLSKPSGFFDFHYKQYTLNRRYAPIYWPLQTLSGSYTVWVYYHRLNEQTLYT